MIAKDLIDAASKAGYVLTMTWANDVLACRSDAHQVSSSIAVVQPESLQQVLFESREASIVVEEVFRDLGIYDVVLELASGG